MGHWEGVILAARYDVHEPTLHMFYTTLTISRLALANVEQANVHAEHVVFIHLQ